MKAGVAEQVITPSGSWPMDGYALRRGTSLGTLDDLLAQVLVLDAGQRVVLVTLDLIGVDATFTAELRAAIGRRFGIPPRHVLVTASHTHAGPAGFVSLWSPDAWDCPLRPYVVDRVVEAVQRALQTMGEVRWQVCPAGVEGVGSDRNDPDGEPERGADVAVLWRGDGRIAAVVVHYACHPTVLGPDNRLFSTDFVGPMRRLLATGLRTAGYGEPTVLFVNGAAADVSPRFTRRARTPAEAQRLGSLLGAQALAAVLAADPDGATAPRAIHVAQCELELPLRAPAAEAAALDERIEATREELARAREAGLDARRLRLWQAHLEGLIAQRTWGVREPVARTCLQAIAAGDTVWLAVPGELDRELARRLRSASPFRHTLIAGYANDYIGYILGSRLAAAGTYEALAARLAPGGGERLCDAASALLHQLWARVTEAGGDLSATAQVE